MSQAESFRQEQELVLNAERRSVLARQKAAALLIKYSEDNEEGNPWTDGAKIPEQNQLDGMETPQTEGRDEMHLSLATIDLDDKRAEEEIYEPNSIEKEKDNDQITQESNQPKTRHPTKEDYEKLKGGIIPLSPQSKTKSKRLSGSYEFILDNGNELRIVKSKDESCRSLMTNGSNKSPSSPERRKGKLPPRHNTPTRASGRGSLFSRFSSNRSQRSASGSWRVGSFEESRGESNAATDDALVQETMGSAGGNKPPALPPSNRSEFESNRGVGSTISDGDRDEIISVISIISEITDATPERTKQGLTVITSTDRTNPRIPDTLLLKVKGGVEKFKRYCYGFGLELSAKQKSGKKKKNGKSIPDQATAIS